MLVAIIITADRPKYVFRKRLQRKTLAHLQSIGVTPYYVVGNADRTELVGDTLFVDVPDIYENLPFKVWKAIEFFRECADQGIIKMDDDTTISSLTIPEGVHYAGAKFVTAVSATSRYHCGLCKCPIYSKGTTYLPQTPFAGGPLYWISQEFAKRLTLHDYSHLIYEDVATGLAASRLGYTRLDRCTLDAKAVWGMYDNKKSPFVVPVLQGGLGNMLFIMAAAYNYAAKHKSFMGLNGIPKSPHSDLNYATTIFRRFKGYEIQRRPSRYITEKATLEPVELPPVSRTVGLRGYFQNWQYLQEFGQEFCSQLWWNWEVAKKYPLLKDSYFLHVRRGDYLKPEHSQHNVDLTRYYQACLAAIGEAHVYVFTNDLEYCKSWLAGTSYDFVTENEWDSLYLMSQCGKGGIGANSSFSWWGAYLNPDRDIYLPSKWYTRSEFYTEGLYYPGWKRVSVEDGTIEVISDSAEEVTRPEPSA